MRILDFDVEMLRADTVVVGSGAAGLAAACRLCEAGRDVALVTEGLRRGTSVNAGSDKQTYYTPAVGDGGLIDAAQSLFGGGGMHGDHALIEAALSARCFYYLVESGMPFPRDGFGQYAGYRTDHDAARRATSAGPLTSRWMARALAKRAFARGVRIMEGLQAVDILLENGRAAGVLALNASTCTFTVIAAGAVVWATGGPGGLYGRSVYPEDQAGATGIPLMRGARAVNLCEGQFGIASLWPRWNLSGSYQQVLPRYYSEDGAGMRHDFLSAGMESVEDVLAMTFLKGYQWPFDVRKLGEGGSSRIDMLVDGEIRRGRRVFMDYTRNPLGEYPLTRMGGEARAYLERSGAIQRTPFERLAALNPLAVQKYRDAGVDLAETPLEIAVCAQHMNGGLAVDEHWMTDVPGLYAVGEAAGTHGVYRPGGSALNSGQVGALRASEHIMRAEAFTPSEDALADAAQEAMALAREQLGREGALMPEEALIDLRVRTDGAAGIERSADAATLAGEEALEALERLLSDGGSEGGHELGLFFRVRDHLVAQAALLNAIEYQSRIGISMGSALIPVPEGRSMSMGIPYDVGGVKGDVLYTAYEGGRFCSYAEPVRPIPIVDDWFENVWRAFREREGTDGGIGDAEGQERF